MNIKTENWINEAWEGIHEKVKETSQILSTNPSMTKDGIYKVADRDSAWTVGFWPGLLWLLYEETAYEPYKVIAERCQERLGDASKHYFTLSHDIGFIWQLTAIKHYQLTGDELSRKRALTAASHLTSRFNIKGNFLQAWNKNDVNEANHLGLSIIDSMMNLPLLMFATKETGSPRFEHIARAHADMVTEHFIRPDWSVNHMVEFNPYTGEKMRVHGGQGNSETSAWSRGTSWAVHGMSTFYGLTKDEKYLTVAKNVADFFIRELPEDNVPHWDFRVEKTENTPRDTSAGACAACGLLELSEHLEGEEKEYYITEAKKIIKGIYDNYSTLKDDKHQGLVRGGTFNYPQGLGIDISLIYGDYYFTEAIYRLKKMGA